MFDKLTRLADSPGREFMAIIFIASGIDEIGAFEIIQGYMEAFGLPVILPDLTILFQLSAMGFSVYQFLAARKEHKI